MRKFPVLFVLIMLIIGLCACGGEKAPATTSPISTTEAGTTSSKSTTASEATKATTSSTVDPATCKHAFLRTKTIVKEGPFNEGEAEFECRKCGLTKTEKVPTTIKILAIGNSFSVDAMEYLYNICADAGIENIVLGNLYIGGCSLDTHWNNIKSGAAAYTYYKNTSGKWVSYTKGIPATVWEDDWDFITVQQVSQNSGMPDTYGNLDNILNWLEENKPEDCKIYWHMTWAYQQSSTHSGFANYKNNQMNMYNAIVDTVNSVVLTKPLISGVIPSGTTVQNMRTSYLGDTLTRDGYHMSYDYGRYATALTWFAELIGGDIDKITWVPESYTYVKEDMALIREAVSNAIKDPYKVTESSYKTKEEKSNITELSESDIARIKALGYDPDDYALLELDFTVGAYYQSVSSSTLYTKGNTTASNTPYFAATQIFSKSLIPNGSLIVVDKGYQYRPEGWVSLSSKNSADKRPANVSEECVVVSDEWWTGFSYRAFNLSYIGSTTNMTEEDTSHLHIYVLKDGLGKQEEEVKVTLEDLKDESKYKQMDIEFYMQSYYNSSSATYKSTLVSKDNGTFANLPYFAATPIFTKEELPVGAVIVVDKGYQYRPEGWTALNTVTSPRPGNTSEEITVVTEDWWAGYSYRAFNLSYIGSMTPINTDDISHFRIYIPVK